MYSYSRYVILVILASIAVFCSTSPCRNHAIAHKDDSEGINPDGYPNLNFLFIKGIEIPVDDDVPVECKRINLGCNMHAEFVKQTVSPFTAIFNIYDDNYSNNVSYDRRVFASGSRCGECGDFYSVWIAEYSNNSFCPSEVSHGVIRYKPDMDETAELCRMILDKKNYDETFKIKKNCISWDNGRGYKEIPDSLYVFFEVIKVPGFWESDINGGTTALLTSIRNGWNKNYYINNSLAAKALYSPGPMWVHTFNAEGDDIGDYVDATSVDVKYIIEDFYK